MIYTQTQLVRAIADFHIRRQGREILGVRNIELTGIDKSLLRKVVVLLANFCETSIPQMTYIETDVLSCRNSDAENIEFFLSEDMLYGSDKGLDVVFGIAKMVRRQSQGYVNVENSFLTWVDEEAFAILFLETFIACPNLFDFTDDPYRIRRIEDHIELIHGDFIRRAEELVNMDFFS